MTPKEAFKGLCDLSRVDDEDFKMWVGLKGEVEQALTELEELKRDMKRYFELGDKAEDSVTNEEVKEFSDLEIKLYQKVFRKVIYEIDINKLKKGDTVLVKHEDGRYMSCDIIGVSIKNNTISCDVGDYATYYHVPLSDCKPYFSDTYIASYLKEKVGNEE